MVRPGGIRTSLPVREWGEAALDAEVIWLCVGDDAIEAAGAEGVRGRPDLRGQIVAHSSGARTAGALEAARNGCALLLNDIPSLREVWGDAAAYFACDDAVALGKELRHLAAHPSRRRRLAQAAEHRARERYGRGLMVQRYIAAYARVMGNGRAGARA